MDRNARNTANAMTEGPIARTLIWFALPILFGSLVQQLYNTVDLIFVGNLVGSKASSAIGVSSMMINLLVGFFSGLSVGSGVVISQAYGAGDMEQVRKGLQNVLILSVGGGLLLLLIAYPLAPMYLRWTNAPEELMHDAVGYLRIYIFSFISILTYNIGSGALRALGDSKTPLYAQIVGGLGNIVMDGFCLAFLHMGVFGVAYATFVSQTIAALMVAYKLFHLQGGLAVRIREIRPDRKIMKRIMLIGIPAGTQAMVMTLSNIMAQTNINTLGSASIAAFTAYYKIELFIYYPIFTLGQALMTFAGQNIGAGKMDRVRRGTRVTVMLGVGLTLVLSALFLLTGHAWFRAFAKEEEVIALGLRIFRVILPFYFLYNFLQLFGDTLRGCGMVREPMIIVLVMVCLFRTAFLFWNVPRTMCVEGVAVAYPLTWALTGASMTWMYFRKIKTIQLPQDGR